MFDAVDLPRLYSLKDEALGSSNLQTLILFFIFLKSLMSVTKSLHITPSETVAKFKLRIDTK